jgi:hypothetical protein
MDKLGAYRSIVQRLIREYAQIEPGHGAVETVAVCDAEHDHYLVIHLGWSNGYRHDQPVLYLRLHHGKVWVERDSTPEGIVTALLDAGVPAEDIVQGYIHPSERHYTEFAVA